ncbi:MAG: hypothetical protein GXP45_03380 [bacterium]|nr:hypothetical protein [bacterium]
MINNINPNTLRLFSQKLTDLKASDKECAVLNQIYFQASLYQQYRLKSMMDKLKCSIDISLMNSQHHETT